MMRKSIPLVEKKSQSSNEGEKNEKVFLPLVEKGKRYFARCCGSPWDEIINFDRLAQFFYKPTDPASLGVARALFGLCMVLDVVEERGLADIDLKWGDPYGCHFPLIHGMKPPRLPWMILLYTLMWMGAFGIMLGFWFKFACALFVVPFWYIFLLDKTFWNNHTYLYGLVATLFWTSDANRSFAVDAQITNHKITTIPLWNYFIIKFQFFALYFLAGLKKSGREWLEGYSMMNLSQHWVFNPFKILLTTEQIDFFIVHWFGFIFDITVGFWMLIEKTRIPAMVFCTAFHLMNSRLFSIGMFPYVCLATMPLFCSDNWPRKSLQGVISLFPNAKFNHNLVRIQNRNEDSAVLNDAIASDRALTSKKSRLHGRKKLQGSTKKQKIVVSLILIYVALQIFLPYSHFITKGYNNWVPGLYGYSWDMMVHSWDTVLIIIRVHDNINNKDHFIDPHAWVQSDKWSKHGDMVIQYAQCLKDNLLRYKKRMISSRKPNSDTEEWSNLSTNLSIYIDVRCSLNGRFQQRIFDPNVDMLTANWHPLKPVSFLMPLLTQFSSFRDKMDAIAKQVYTWSNYTDVLFVADYPNMQLENYFGDDFSNITLTVLEGEVSYSEEDWVEKVTVLQYDSWQVTPGKLHQIRTISSNPSSFMYTFTNRTQEQLVMSETPEQPRNRAGFPIIKEIKYKANAWWRSLGHVANAFFNLLYDVPMTRRIPRSPDYYEHH